MKKLRHIDEPLTEHQIRVARAAYYGMCELFDASVGRVLDKLDETGLAEDTLVVYTTDHGEAAGEHGMWWKSSYYEESVGVPLIARLPGVITQRVEESRSSATPSTSLQHSWRRQGRASYAKSQAVPFGQR